MCAAFRAAALLWAFAGVDPGCGPVRQASDTKQRSYHKAWAHRILRKTLYQIVCTYLRKAPADEPVYQFLDKKRAEGKPYFVYMTAAQNKFLRIYYARVKECLEAFDSTARHLTRINQIDALSRLAKLFLQPVLLCPFSAVQILRDFFHFSY